MVLAKETRSYPTPTLFTAKRRLGEDQDPLAETTWSGVCWGTSRDLRAWDEEVPRYFKHQTPTSKLKLFEHVVDPNVRKAPYHGLTYATQARLGMHVKWRAEALQREAPLHDAMRTLVRDVTLDLGPPSAESSFEGSHPGANEHRRPPPRRKAAATERQPPQVPMPARTSSPRARSPPSRGTTLTPLVEEGSLVDLTDSEHSVVPEPSTTDVVKEEEDDDDDDDKVEEVK